MNSTTCPSCKVAVKYKDEFAGRKMRCPRCQAIFALPTVKLARVRTAARQENLEKGSIPLPPPSKPGKTAAPSRAGQAAKAPSSASARGPAKVSAPVFVGKAAPAADLIPDDLDSRPEEDLDALLATAQLEKEAAEYDRLGATDETPALPDARRKKGSADAAETEEFPAIREEEEAVIDIIDESLAPAKNKGKEPPQGDEFPDIEEEEAQASVSDVQQEEEIESPSTLEQEEEEPPRKPVRPPLPATPPKKQKGGGNGNLLLMVLVFVVSVAVGLGGYYLILISSGG